MPSPRDNIFIGQAGRVRLSPLEQAVASSKTGGNDASANRATANPHVASNRSGQPELDPAVDLPPGVTPKDVADAQDAAKNGDPEAASWLKGLGITAAAVAGTAAAGYGIKKGLAARGAKNIAADTKVPNANSTTSKRANQLVPFDGVVVDEQVIKRGHAPPPHTVYQPGEGMLPRLTDGRAGRTGPIYQSADPNAPMLPAPTRVITDQTGTRFAQPAPGQPIMITDQNAAGRARAAAAPIEGWRQHLGTKFKVKPATGRATMRAIRRVF